MGKRLYNYNENYFNKIDSPEKAYWLGFITADGYVIDNTKKDNLSKCCGLRIRLSEIDKNHLEKLNESIHSDKPIKIVKNYGIYDNCKPLAEFSINSRTMMRDLENLGLTSGNKSGNEIPPTFLSKELQKYFILGLFDGDGTLSVGKRLYELNFLSSEKMVIFIKNYLEENLKIMIKNKIEKRTYKNKSLYRFRICSKSLIIRTLDFLYNDSYIYLDRKYELYKSIK